jgi:uncharacterized ion transporter superfamily protein YfcC
MEIFVGAVVSLIVQLIKKLAGTREWVTLGLVLLFSLVGALFLNFIQSIGYLESFYKVLVTAGAFYAFIIKRF